MRGVYCVSDKVLHQGTPLTLKYFSSFFWNVNFDRFARLYVKLSFVSKNHIKWCVCLCLSFYNISKTNSDKKKFKDSILLLYRMWTLPKYFIIIKVPLQEHTKEFQNIMICGWNFQLLYIQTVKKTSSLVNVTFNQFPFARIFFSFYKNRIP